MSCPKEYSLEKGETSYASMIKTCLQIVKPYRKTAEFILSKSGIGFSDTRTGNITASIKFV
jgi:hypothetical protein